MIIYTATWCGPCDRLKNRLVERGIAFDEVDIEQDEAAADWVAGVNDGNQAIPTVRFPDGSWLTNPSVDAVVERLATSTALSES